MPLIADQPITLGSFDITPQFEHRARWERRTDRDFIDTVRDNVTDWQFRTRLGFTGKDKDGNKITFRWQMGYSDAMSAGKQTVVQNSDVTLLSWERTFGDWTVTLGRQAYVLGDGKLVTSSTGWSNLGRTFEGLRLTSKAWDLFGFKETINSPSNKELTAGLASYKSEFGQTTLIYKSDERGATDTEIYTLNHIYKSHLGQYSLMVEGSGQWGESKGRDHAAFAGTLNLSRKFSKQLSGYFEASLVSGGSGPKSGTFDSLFFSPKPTYGMRTMTGYRNLKELTLGATFVPDSKWRFDGYVNWFGLFDSKDAWYGSSGSVNRHGGIAFQDPTGASGDEVGTALQVEAFYTPTKRDTFGAGIGLFRPGAFIDRQLSGSAKEQVWGYFLYQFKF